MTSNRRVLFSSSLKSVFNFILITLHQLEISIFFHIYSEVLNSQSAKNVSVI